MLTFVLRAYLGDLNREELWILLLVAAGSWIAHRRWPELRRLVLPKLPFGAPIIFLLAIVARVLLLPLVPVPEPRVHDEFSYLLQADTFAHGRLTNPTPPFWQHFESMHVFMQPTYNSMYFPMQAIFLAIGQVLGNPWIGVLLSGAMMCAAIVWALEAWMPARWAFIAGLVAIVHTMLFSYWINGYYGGFHAGIGGALVLGAWPRLVRKRSVLHAVVLAIGLAILAAGRPWEGMILSLPVAIGMLFFQTRPARDPRVFAPVIGLLLIAACAMGFYFYRVTGSPFRTPYQVNRDTYGWPQTLMFLPSPPPPPNFRHAEMATYYKWETLLHKQIQAPSEAVLLFFMKYLLIWTFFVGPALTLGLVMLPRVLGDRRIRPLLFPLAAVLLALAFSQSVVPHYAAPAAAAIFAVIVQGFRHLRVWRLRNDAAGLALTRAVPVVLLLVLAIRIGVPAGAGDNMFSWCCVTPQPHPSRADFARELAAIPGNHLVLVRYGANHSFHDEWVYNAADIPASRIIWARTMTKDENRAMVNYFADRHVWLLEPDATPPSIRELTR